MRIICAHCGKGAHQATGAVNRARRKGAPLYCDRICAGLSRRKHKTKAQKVEEKRLYDAQYRAKNLARIKAEKKAYFRKTYDPDAARVERKKRAPFHAEYCRRPEYRRWKSDYDLKRRAKEFGEYAESYLILHDINKEVSSRMSKYDIYLANQTYGKAQRRRREYGQLVSGKP